MITTTWVIGTLVISFVNCLANMLLAVQVLNVTALFFFFFLLELLVSACHV